MCRIAPFSSFITSPVGLPSRFLLALGVFLALLGSGVGCGQATLPQELEHKYWVPNKDEPLLAYPFRAEEIRAAYREGRRARYLVENSDGYSRYIEERVIYVTDRKFTKLRALVDSDGYLLEKPQERTMKWEELAYSDRYPVDVTTVRDFSLTTPAGTFECKLYIVTTPGDNEKVYVSRTYYARDFPGGPIKEETQVNGEMQSNKVLVVFNP